VTMSSEPESADESNISELVEWAQKMLDKMRTLPQLADAYHRSVRSHKAAIDTQDIGVVANIALLCCRRRCEESRESEEK